MPLLFGVAREKHLEPPLRRIPEEFKVGEQLLLDVGAVVVDGVNDAENGRSRIGRQHRTQDAPKRVISKEAPLEQPRAELRGRVRSTRREERLLAEGADEVGRGWPPPIILVNREGEN